MTTETTSPGRAATERPQPPAPASAAGRVQWWALVFLGMLVFQPAFDPEAGTVDWVIAAAAGVAYLPVYMTGDRGSATVRERVVIVSLLFGLAVTPFNTGASVFFVYSAAFAGTLESPVRARRWMTVATGLLVLMALLSTVPFPYRLLSFGPPLLFVWVVGSMAITEAEKDRESARLRIDNARIEYLATMAERDRIARDLHDLLGHTLTAVVVRAQLAQRLAGHDPARAQAEAQRIEQDAREALTAVRETVAGYRHTTLEAEVEHAGTALAAAGVRLDADIDADVDLSRAVETALALSLREGVTNVVRHAQAQACRVRLTHEVGHVRLEVSDDGRGGGQEGNGLRGIRERITALGGTVERRAGSGTVLTITVPAALAGPTGPGGA